MSNPFELIEQRLMNIESLLLSMKNNPVEEGKLKENVEEKPMSQNEAAKFLGKTRATIIKWRRDGHIKAYKIGGRIYFKPSELAAALQSLS